MDRDQKAAAVKEIGEELDASSAVFAVDYRGISVPQAAELRSKLRESDASFNVVKNRLAKRATEAAGAAELDEHLVGPTALTFVRGDAVLAAKAIADFTRQNGVLAYKGGLMDGAALDPDQFTSIARLPGVDVLRGQLVGLAASPLTGIVRTLNQLVGGLASQLGQIAERGLVSGEAPAEPEKPDAEEAEIAEAPGTEEAGEEAAEETPSEEPEATDGPEAGAVDEDAPVADEPAGEDEAAADAEPPAEPEGEDAPEQTTSDDQADETPEDAGDDDSEDEKEA
jgi:large subunit ribosomal protein L10